MALTLTTELQAINIMLGTIGESPVSSLDAGSAVADSAIAREILKEVSIQVQEESWHFNTEKSFTLSPALGTKEITLPTTCIQADTVGASQGIDVAVRAGKLYNRTSHTYQFDGPVVVDMVLLLEWDELPQAARHYITIRAARVFQKRTLGSESIDAFTKEDEFKALIALKRYDSRTANYNMLSGSYSVARILNR